jgi:hypothetical protein
LGALPQEHILIGRAVSKTVAGTRIRIAAVEDLILLKLLSERPKDLDDARRLLRRFRATLDTSYLEPQIRELAEVLARPDVVELYLAEMPTAPT